MKPKTPGLDYQGRFPDDGYEAREADTPMTCCIEGAFLLGAVMVSSASIGYVVYLLVDLVRGAMQ